MDTITITFDDGTKKEYIKGRKDKNEYNNLERKLIKEFKPKHNKTNIK